ncbi:MAG: hypothetical protein U0441_16330 [Polyangiaceae bacterium]
MRSRSFIGAAALIALVTLPAFGCLERPLHGNDPRSTAEVVEPLKLSAVERIDLLLAIDNSASMGDKQDILARAVPDLVKRLANPRCIDTSGNPASEQPQSPTAACPDGTEREFLAVPDIHVGIVSSSLGGTKDGRCAQPTDNDHGRLLSRTLSGSNVPTYGGFGFLAWDPDKKLDPPGESVLDNGTSGLVPSLQEMVRGVGESGCGYEAQLESWYRFLIQPDPWESLVQKGDSLTPKDGVDKTLLAQRKAFLRPDSLVAIIQLTDENDCSVAPGPDAARIFSKQSMIRPREECAADPNDACCAPCDQAPAGCAEQASCKDASGNWARIEGEDANGRDLRCFDQKRRFGKSYLYPTERYVTGLTELHVPDRYGNLTSNPLFMDLNLDDDIHGQRTPDLVFFAGIVGVPWQDIAKDPTTLAKGLKSGEELIARDAEGHSTWDRILGDPEKGTLPLDPHMWESQKPRTGLPDATSAFGADPISGHEQKELATNLQFACTFPLLSPIPCAGDISCDCYKPDGNPLCQAPSGEYTQDQVAAKAFPGLRELSVLKGLQKQAIVASVCPSNMDEAAEKNAEDFGYRPAVGALIDRLKGKLGHQCLPRQLTPNKEGKVGCLVIEARKSESCSCKAEDARTSVATEHVEAIQGALQSGIIDEDDNCFCEIPQLSGAELTSCQNDKDDPQVVDGQQVNGWCYIDATAIPAVGSKELVPESCTEAEKRLIRFVGTAKARPGSDMFIMCTEG